MKKRKSYKAEIPVEPDCEEVQEGLSTAQVNERVQAGLVNGKPQVTTKSYGRIFRSNTFTFFNILHIVLAVLVLAVAGEIKNAGFLLLVFFNWLIGIIQEVRAKRTIDKLSLISAPKVTVLRDDEQQQIAVADIVMDDVMVLDAGKQVCADCTVIDGSCEVNESLITGESDPVGKEVGGELLSGSFIVSGRVKARVTHIGADNYANKISSGAKYIKSNNSEILRSLRAVIKLMSTVVVPLGVLLFLKQWLIQDESLPASIVKMVSSMTNMIPQGLMALSSAVFAVGVVRLSRHKTLAQDLYCIETLARVDVLCLDKTGTITQGCMQVEAVVPQNDTSAERINEGLQCLVALLPDNNPTYNAVREYVTLDGKERTAQTVVPFSSARKWSGVTVQDGSYIMGAMEFVLRDQMQAYSEQMQEYAAKGQRVLVLAYSPRPIADEQLPKGLQLCALLLITDTIRPEAPETLRYFAQEGVDIRIISGDNATTVAAIARKAGLANCEAVDMSTIETNEQLIEASRRYKVFGRVTPEQKLKLVMALKGDGHTVAMTGDGVNDVLALKEADCSIAMASGSDAARNVAQLVLLDSNFASMPRIVAEGRRSINNLQRSATLYLVKTMWGCLLTLLFLFMPDTYPFEPTNITLVGAAMIGIPSFFLALEPNKERVKGHFLQNAVSRSIPGALAIVMASMLLQLLLFALKQNAQFVLTDDQRTTVFVLVLTIGEFAVLTDVCLPFDVKHCLYIVASATVFVLGWLSCSLTISIGDWKLDNLFSMSPINTLTPSMGVYIGSAAAFCLIVYVVVRILIARYNVMNGKRLLHMLRLEDKA